MIVLLVQTGAAWFMTGLIWTMQILNYPLLALIDSASFVAYETAHNRRFIAVVGPGVLVMVVTTVRLFVSRPPAIPLAALLAVALLLLVVFVSTAFYGARLHTKLARGFDPAAHATLVRSNWVRTFAWTLLAFDLWMVAEAATLSD